jgi:hypothetical protein
LSESFKDRDGNNQSGVDNDGVGDGVMEYVENCLVVNVPDSLATSTRRESSEAF